jgi:hypothetical protein
VTKYISIWCLITPQFKEKDKVLAVGTVDGLVSVARKLEESETAKKTPRVRYGIKEWDKVLKRIPDVDEPETADANFAEKVKSAKSQIDRHLSSYRYSKALDVALTPYNRKRKPEVAVSLMQELIRYE